MKARNLSNVGREQKYCKRGLQVLEEYLGALLYFFSNLASIQFHNFIFT